MPLAIHKNLLNTNTEEETTFTLTVESLESRPNIKISFNGVKRNDIMVAFNVAKSAFRQVEIINEQTGEVATTYYMSDEFHSPSRSYGDVINYLTKFCYEM